MFLPPQYASNRKQTLANDTYEAVQRTCHFQVNAYSQHFAEHLWAISQPFYVYQSCLPPLRQFASVLQQD
eukprot:6214074-Amphidinium_carterae.1